jgi:hypothetical protein
MTMSTTPDYRRIAELEVEIYGRTFLYIGAPPYERTGMSFANIENQVRRRRALFGADEEQSWQLWQTYRLP